MRDVRKMTDVELLMALRTYENFHHLTEFQKSVIDELIDRKIDFRERF